MIVNIPMTFESDEKGYFDRQCPNENCLFEFKILMEDWKEKVSDDEVHCPMCGHVAPSKSWYTDEQRVAIRENARNFARSHVINELNKTFNDFERSLRGNKYIKVQYKPHKPATFVNNPIGAKEEWALEITCDKCGTRYSVIGSAYFCPCCGYNSAGSVFDNSIDTITKMVNSLDEMKQTLSEQLDRDTAENMCRSMLENSLGQIISAFQKFAQCRYKELTSIEQRVNDFQMVDKGSKLFFDATGKGYEHFLSPDELDLMRLLFQRRHILEHNSGIVDQKYIDNSGDKDYTIGQRIIVKETDAMDLIDVITKLSKGLKSLH